MHRRVCMRETERVTMQRCVCVCERESERGSQCSVVFVCVCERERVTVHRRVCVCASV